MEIQLRKDEFSQEEKKQINELLKSNAIMKKYLEKSNLNGDNKVEILECIRKNKVNIDTGNIPKQIGYVC